MAIVKRTNNISKDSNKNNAILSNIYDTITIDNNKIFQLLKAESEFIKYLKEIIESIKKRDADDILNSLIVISKTAKEKITEVANKFDDEREKNIFRKFAVSRLSRELSILEKYCSENINQKKINSIKEYCEYLLENSKIHYADFEILGENISYYKTYISLSNDDNIDFEKLATHNVFKAAIESAIENNDIPAAKNLININAIKSTFIDDEINIYINKISNLEVSLYLDELFNKFIPKSSEELIKNSNIIRSELETNMAEQLVKKLEEYFYFSKLSDKFNEERVTLNIIYETLIKIYNTDISMTEIMSLNLPDNIILFLRNIVRNQIDNHNNKNIKKNNTIYKTIYTKIINGEIDNIFMLIDNNEINESLRVYEVIKLLKVLIMSDKKRVDIEEVKNGDL